MSDRPRVSVVTANLHGEHVAAAIRSVLRQTLTSLEMIVVDNASTDESLAAIARGAADDPRVRVLRQPKRMGPGSARNRGLDAVKGRWIAVFESDDLMSPDRLQRLVDCAEADLAEIVVDNLILFSEAETEPWLPYLTGPAYATPHWLSLADYLRSGRIYSNRPSLGHLKPLICADTLKRTGIRYREDLSIGEDYDLVLRLLAEGARMRLDPGPLYRLRKAANERPQTVGREQLRAMLAADADFAARYPDQPADVRRAQAARRRSLQAALTYDGVIAQLKAHDVRGGLRVSLHDPAVWPLLAMTATARLKDFASRLQHPHEALSAPT